MEGKKTVLITGCSPGGIGHALALAFHASGLHVFATARNEKALEDLTKIGIDALSLEVTSPIAIAEVKKYVSERTGGSLDYLVNNAGRNYTVPALDIDFVEVQDVLNTNVIAVMRMCQAFGPLLMPAKGTIVNIGSVAAEIPYVFGSVYNASKAALHAFSDTLRVELAPFDVKVMVVVTGGVKSNIVRTKRELPADSAYLPLKEGYEARQLHPQVNAMSTTAYAATVVQAALKKKPARSLWQGNQAWTIWMILAFLPKVFWDYYFARLFGLNKLAELLKGHKKDR
ncbi:hypothetical protein P7C71_g4443, partial [Lecanoromycetidae sp. Uapishka_2]